MSSVGENSLLNFHLSVLELSYLYLGFIMLSFFPKITLKRKESTCLNKKYYLNMFGTTAKGKCILYVIKFSQWIFWTTNFILRLLEKFQFFIIFQVVSTAPSPPPGLNDTPLIMKPSLQDIPWRLSLKIEFDLVLFFKLCDPWIVEGWNLYSGWRVWFQIKNTITKYHSN